jgi:hypothetical protein
LVLITEGIEVSPDDYGIKAWLISDAHQPVQGVYRCAIGELERPLLHRVEL